jgi:hypothetical protein
MWPANADPKPSYLLRDLVAQVGQTIDFCRLSAEK